MSDDHGIRIPKVGPGHDPWSSDDPEVQAQLKAAQDAAMEGMRQKKARHAARAAKRDPEVLALRLKDWLTETTRKEGRRLLSVSLLGVVVAITGVVPSKITTIGVEIDPGSRQALLTLAGFVTLYLVGAFTLHASADYLAHEQETRAALARAYGRFFDPDGALYNDVSDKEVAPVRSWLNAQPFAASAVYYLRLSIDFVFPILVGFATSCLLWTSEPAPSLTIELKENLSLTAGSPPPPPSAAPQSPQPPTDDPPPLPPSQE